MDERQESNIIESHNAGYTAHSALQIRLQTDALLRDLRLRLSGMREVPTELENGSIVFKEEAMGKAFLNEAGVHQLMFLLSSLINPAVVQGNFVDENAHLMWCLDVDGALLEKLTIAAPDWGLNPSDIGYVYSVCKNLIRAYTTRLIRNKERESYAATMKMNETISNAKRGLFG